MTNKQGSRLSDRDLMERAVAQARACVSEPGKVSPMVGAVLARDGVLLGEAYRGELKDGEHAEYTLLERKLGNDVVAGATLFTTLEPCTARGEPKIPCVERVIERRVAKIVIGVLDPNGVITGRGQLALRSAGIEVAVFDPDLMAQIEDLNRDFTRDQVGSAYLYRTEDQKHDPADGSQLGPNGYPISYTEEGDKVEWIPTEDGTDESWPMVLRRGDPRIIAEYNELWDKVWWNRHQVWREKLEIGTATLREGQEVVFKRAAEAARRIEDKYGRENLGWDDFEWGMLSGRLSALSWVIGSEWDESLDT